MSFRLARVRGAGFRLLPTVVAVIYAFLFLPIIVVVMLSFGENISVVSLTDWSFKWYRQLWANDMIQKALWFSLRVGLLSACVAMVIGTAAAFVLTRHEFRGRSFIRAALFSPLIVPEIIVAVGLLSFFALLGIPRGFVSLVVGHTLLILPYVVSTVTARLYGFDRTLEEAAHNLGAAPWRVVAEVTLPLLMPAIIAGGLIAFKVSFDEVVGSLFWSSVRDQTLPVVVFAMVQYELTPQVNAVGTLMIIVTLAVLACSELVKRRQRA